MIWREMDDAPRDGTWFLAYWETDVPAYRYGIVCWREEAGWVIGSDEEPVAEPQFWCALPEHVEDDRRNMA